MERSYIAFISYKHTARDAAIAKQVHTLIESYVIPRSLRKDGKKLGVVFRDEEELPISSDLTESICTALDASRYLIVICSPEAKESPWVAREVSYFLKNHDAKDAFVVLADGEPNDVFPHELTHVLNKSTGEYQEVEPLAMDVRADTVAASLKKARNHIRKLYAGMLGCTYDSLVQREKTRKRKRLAALTALCVLLVSCFTGMLFVKNLELSRKNDELTAAINLALNRESALLAGQAEEALQEGDVAAAIRYAGDALYSGEIERPYYAPAERALFAAFDVLQETDDTPILSKVALKHRAPIAMMACSDDGTAVYTIDAYGMVSSFDAATGELLWEVKLKENETTLSVEVEPQLWYDAESGILACCYDHIFTGLDARNGSISWQKNFDSVYCSGLYYDAEGKKLAYIGWQSFTDWDDYSASYTDYKFVAFSIRDGRVLHDIPILRRPMLDTVSFGTSLNKRSSGMFVGSDRFVGTLFKTEDGVAKTLLYTVSLSDGTVSFIENDAFDSEMDYLRTFYVGNDRVLVLSDKSDPDPKTGLFDYQLRLQCFDLKAGSLLWENAVTPGKYISSEARCFAIPGKKGIVVAGGTSMFVVDPDSGELLASTELRAEIIDLYSLVDGLFAFTLADGYCAIGWRSRGDLCDSRLYAATVDLPDTPEVLSHNGGLIQVYFTGNMIDGFSILPQQEGGGSMIYLSEDRCTAYAASVLPQPVLPEPVPVAAKEAGVSDVGSFIDENPQGKVLMGISYLTDGYGLTVVDPVNHSLQAIRLDGYISFGDKRLYLTRDGQRVLVCTDYGDIYSIGMDGAAASIAVSETVTLKIVGDTEIVAQAARADAARQTTDGRILTARSDGRSLHLWLDGGEETIVPLPEDVCWGMKDGLEICAMLHAGENGLVILSDFASGDTKEIENFAVYDLASKKWRLIPDAARGSHERKIIFSENKLVFAVYDADMTIRVYDGKTGELLHCINTGLPMVSVLKTGMLLDAQYIYVLTQDGQFIIYSVETNERVLRTVFSNVSAAAAFSAWLDRGNERLYLRMDTKALCLDVRSWEELFSGKDFKFYSAAQNEIYVFSRDRGTSDYSLKAIPIPTTSELIEMVQETLR